MHTLHRFIFTHNLHWSINLAFIWTFLFAKQWTTDSRKFIVFSSAAAYGLLKKSSRLFSFGGNNAFLEFFLEGVPGILHTHMDSKKVRMYSREDYLTACHRSKSQQNCYMTGHSANEPLINDSSLRGVIGVLVWAHQNCLMTCHCVIFTQCYTVKLLLLLWQLWQDSLSTFNDQILNYWLVICWINGKTL